MILRRLLLVAAAVTAAAATVTHWSVLMIAVALYCATLLPFLRTPSAQRTGDADQTGSAIVISVATGIVVLHADADAVSVWEVAILLALLHGLHLVRHVLRILVARRWRNVADWRYVAAGPTPVRVEPVAGPTLVPIPVWVVAPILAIFDADSIVYLLLGVVSIALVILTLIPISRALLHNLRMPAEKARLSALTAALRTSSPEILVHFNARTKSAYAITDWMAVLERVNETHPVVILTVDRQPWHFATIPPTGIPLVHLVGAEAIEHFVEQLPSLRIALYPRNSSPNKNLLRVPGLYDVYIGHGESDKGEAVNPATRAFDEVWVAGEAAKTRFLSANIGVRAEQLRVTGRPQLGQLLRLEGSHGGAKKSVVYAPTWEGYFADDGYSSVLGLGDAVLSALLARDDVVVTYLPHPALGTLNLDFAEASARLGRRVRRAGGRSIISDSLTERYAALAACDVLITDVSSDLVDYLALDRPYIVLNPSGSARAAFLAANPSAGAGEVLDADSIATLGAVVDRALSEDPRRADRARVAAEYLGDLSAPPLERFLSELESALDLVRSTRPVRHLPVPAEHVP